MLLNLYDMAWRVAIPCLRRHKRLKEGFDDRLVPVGWPFTPGRGCDAHHVNQGTVVWIQAASGGESWLVHSLVEALQDILREEGTHKELTLFCTTWTRQGLDVLRKLPPELPLARVRIASSYFPLDAPGIMRRALKQLRPALMVLLETELWPGLLLACREAGVPVVVLNGRMTEKSLSGYKWLGSFWKKVCPQRVLAVSDADAIRFAALFGKENVGRMENIKFDRVCPVSRTTERSEGELLRPARPLIALASVREEEEAQLFAFVSLLLQQSVHGHALSVAVAPRHMHRVAAWEQFLAEQHIAFVRRDEEKGGAHLLTDGPRVLLWNTFGELDRLYAMADAVFVGGSLAPLGGQNFLEPLQAGKQVFTGPSTSNFAWAGQGLQQAGLVHTVTDSSALAVTVLDFLRGLLEADTATWGARREKDAARRQEQFLAWLTPSMGGSRKAVQLMLECIAR